MKFNSSEWVKPSVDMPQDDPKFLHTSIEVDLLLTTGQILSGFYDNLKKQWYSIADVCEKVEEKLILGWRTKGVEYAWESTKTTTEH